MDKQQEEIKRETMTLETASTAYDVKLSTLRLMCVRGQIPSRKIGKRRYVTPEAMDAVFKGESAKSTRTKRASR